MHNPLARSFTVGALLRFALPNMVMMVFLSLYTIVDGIFISRYVGTLALSAINMSYPLNCLQMALGIMLASGGSAVIARKMGEDKEEQARQDFTCVVAVSAAVGAVFLVVGNLFLDEILHLLGTSAAQMELCRTYTRILLWFAPAFFLQTVYQVLFVTAGRPDLGLGLTVAGGIANVVLDITFMGPLDMGIAGAVRSLDHDLSGKNFYAARLELCHTPCVLLVNAHHPYGAFAPSLDPWPPFFWDPPVDPAPFLPEVQWMTAAQLQQDWHGAVGELGEAEIEQIRYWNPRTVGEILFNFWD